MSRGLMTQPVIVFYSGDIAEVVRLEPVNKNNARYYRAYLILTPETMGRYGLTDDDLDFDLSSFGVFKRDYPFEYIIQLTGNPENQVWWGLCNFDGTTTISHDIQLVRDQLKNQQFRINSLLSENRSLMLALKEKSEEIREIQESGGKRENT